MGRDERWTLHVQQLAWRLHRDVAHAPLPSRQSRNLRGASRCAALLLHVTGAQWSDRDLVLRAERASRDAYATSERCAGVDHGRIRWNAVVQWNERQHIRICECKLERGSIARLRTRANVGRLRDVRARADEQRRDHELERHVVDAAHDQSERFVARRMRGWIVLGPHAAFRDVDVSRRHIKRFSVRRSDAPVRIFYGSQSIRVLLGEHRRRRCRLRARLRDFRCRRSACAELAGDDARSASRVRRVVEQPHH